VLPNKYDYRYSGVILYDSVCGSCRAVPIQYVGRVPGVKAYPDTEMDMTFANPIVFSTLGRKK